MHLMTRVVFMGSPDFSVPILRALVSSKDGLEERAYDVAGVISQPDRQAGRGRELRPPPVKTLALELGLPLIQPEKLRAPDAMDQLQQWAPDVIVVAAFGQILRPEVLALPPKGCINVHASLLPRWRGAAPVQAAVLAGDAETGITIMKMDKGVDTGAIISQRAILIAPDDSAAILFGKLSLLGADLLVETLPRYLSGDLQPQPQDESKATYAPLLKKEDGVLDFAQPADELARRVRALNPWPGAYFEWRGAALKVHRAHAESAVAPVGKTLVREGMPAVGTKVGLLVLDEVQAPGKKPTGGKAFLAGARDWGKSLNLP